MLGWREERERRETLKGEEKERVKKREKKKKEMVEEEWGGGDIVPTLVSPTFQMVKSTK